MKVAGSLMLSGLALTSAVPLASAPSRKWFDRFVVVVLENTNKATALADPYYRHLASMDMRLNGYQGTTHPSQPNYFTVISSTTTGGVFDDADHSSSKNSLVDLFEPAGISWKAYMEGYYPLVGGACNPIKENYTSGYVRSSSTPSYTPNLKNDAHDTNVTYASKDLRYIVNTMISNKEFMKNTLIHITFDENDIYSPPYYGTNNDVYTVLLGNDSPACTNCIDWQFYNHFSQLTSVEKNWNLTTIPNPDGDGPQWDSWMLPFAKFRAKGSHHYQ